MREIAIALAFLAVAGCSPANEGKMAAVFFNVGEADSALLVTPDGKNVLVDCGRNNMTLQYLDAMGISRIDCLVITHQDADHAGGCRFVEDRFDVGGKFTNGDVEKDIQLGLSASAELELVVAYDSHGIFNSSNDNSILLKAGYGKVKFLFAADCGSGCEREILRTENVDVDVLKVSHHGSRHSTSAQFLARATPSVAVISVGKNAYGHPGNETLQRLGEAGAEVHRTDIDGTIIVETDGSSIKVS